MAEALDLALRPLAAFEIGCLARQALQPGQRGRVGAVFERSIYVSLAETEVCVGPPGLGAGPLNLRCHATPEDWRAAGLREGMAARKPAETRRRELSLLRALLSRILPKGFRSRR